MIIRFTFENFRSFARRAELSFIASRGAEHSHHLRRFPGLEAPLLPVLGLYGANASGKSNAVKALHAMAQMVNRAVETDNSLAPPPYHPFKLRDESLAEPTVFDVEFMLGGFRHRYGFAFTRDRVVREWLHAWPNGTRQIWFERDITQKAGWYFGPAWRGQRHRLAKETENAELFLSTAAHHKNPVAASIRSMFRTWTHSMWPTEARVLFTKSPLYEKSNADFLMAILKSADLGIRDFRVLNMRKRLIEEARSEVTSIEMNSLKELIEMYGDPLALQLGHESPDGTTIWLDPDEESDGTSMLITHLHHILTTLERGGLLIIDELDHAMHPHLAPLLLRFFTSPTRNPRGAQLVFTAHQTALMAELRRDEVYLTEKLSGGESSLSSVADYRALKREDIERFYRAGRFGGVPRISALDPAIEGLAPSDSP